MVRERRGTLGQVFRLRSREFNATGALSELQRATHGLPREYKAQLLADISAIAWALLTHRPQLPGWKQVNDWLSDELARVSDGI